MGIKDYKNHIYIIFSTEKDPMIFSTLPFWVLLPTLFLRHLYISDIFIYLSLSYTSRYTCLRFRAIRRLVSQHLKICYLKVDVWCEASALVPHVPCLLGSARSWELRS